MTWPERPLAKAIPRTRMHHSEAVRQPDCTASCGTGISTTAAPHAAGVHAGTVYLDNNVLMIDGAVVPSFMLRITTVTSKLTIKGAAPCIRVCTRLVIAVG